ncbi:MAG: hypothetical protein AAFP97_11630 [Pseudomonadota bacterium]
MRMRFLLSILLLFSTLLATSAQAQGIRAESKHFILDSDVSLDAEPILQDLEAFRTAVLSDLALEVEDTSEPLRLNIVDDLDVFQSVAPGGITAAIYRQSAASQDVIVGYNPEPGHFLSRALDPKWLRLVLRHEVAHHLLETHYPRKLPIWLNEGLAEYYSTYERSATGEITFGRALPEQEPLTEDGPWLPMRTVIENMAKYPDFRLFATETPAKAQRIYYGQSRALAHFIMDQPDGLASIHRFVDGWTPEADSEDSFEAAFGLRYGPLIDQVKQDIVRRGGKLRTRTSDHRSLARIQTRNRTEREILDNHLRLMLTHGRLDSGTHNQMIERAQAILEPRDATSNLNLARSVRAWRLQRWDLADEYADRILGSEPDHAKALKMKAKIAYGRVSESQSNQALWDAAENAAVKALGVRPNDAELHLFRVAVSLPTTDRLSPGARASLDWLETRKTYLRLPHTAMMMIPALIYEDRFDKADKVLDHATRWTEQSGDIWVIRRLRGNVAAERSVSE